MATAVVCIICIAMIVLGGMTMSQGILISADTAAISVEGMSVREGEIMRTRLVRDSATLPTHSTLQVTMENSGQTKLTSFDKWDFIVQYFDNSDNYYVKWLPYNEGTLGNNEWQETGIYLNGQPEVFEPEILNPAEQLYLRALLNPVAGYRAISAIIVTPNGIAPVVVCGPPTLTAHTETVTLDGNNYYMLKGWTPADGSAVTETTPSISRHQIGRWLLYNSAVPSRYARHLFPLSNVNEIPASTWTVCYRGRADGWSGQTYPNARLNIDVLIRRADGTIRETIDTGVAEAAFTDGGQWLNLSAAYSFPGYTAADETDYLEIDYYGESVDDGPNGTAYIMLRVDDNTLSETSQTRITGMSWS